MLTLKKIRTLKNLNIFLFERWKIGLFHSKLQIWMKETWIHKKFFRVLNVSSVSIRSQPRSFESFQPLFIHIKNVLVVFNFIQTVWVLCHHDYFHFIGCEFSHEHFFCWMATTAVQRWPERISELKECGCNIVQKQIFIDARA